jgi:hypothetical protein
VEIIQVINGLFQRCKRLKLESETKFEDLGKRTTGPISREKIRTALQQVYSQESKPIQVKTIRKRTRNALLYVYLGTIIISLSIGIEYLSLNLNILLPGLMLLIFAFIIGFTLTTKNIRRINRSMSRFKDGSIPAYRTIFNERFWQKHAMVYAVLVTLIFLGAQNFNFNITYNNQQFSDENMADNDNIEISNKMIWLEDVILGPTYFKSGQYFRYITPVINNTINYYNNNLYVIVQSYFAGEVIDEINHTFNIPIDDKLLSIKIHDPDDTSFKSTLKYFGKNGEMTLNSIVRESVDDIYIARTSGSIKSEFLSKSVEISVSIYNERIIKEPEVVTVLVADPIIGSSDVAYTRGKIKNNETIRDDEFWEVKIKFDIYLEHESEFDIKLNIDDKEKDRVTLFLE